jgi:hypothetical protein
VDTEERLIDLYTLIKIIVRRWYAAVPVLAILALVGPGLVDSAEPEYRASGSAVLLRYDPTASVTPEAEEGPPRNPYADFNGSVNITAAVLENIASGDAIRQQVVDNGGTADFTVQQDEDAPILLIEATARTPAEAISSVSVIAAALDAELGARQERFAVPAEERIVMEVVLLPERAAELETARNRALTVLIAMGVAGVIASTVIAESFAHGRARNRRAAERAAATREARIAELTGASPNPTPVSGVPLPPDPSAFEASNGEPATPVKQRRR